MSKETVYVKTELTKKNQPKDCFFIGFTADHPNFPQQFYYEDNKFSQINADGKKEYFEVTHWLKETIIEEVKYELFDKEHNSLIKLYSDEELIEFANKEQEKYDSHNFILFTVSQCKGYIMNWCDNINLI
jgi:hypothetical protein